MLCTISSPIFVSDFPVSVRATGPILARVWNCRRIEPLTRGVQPLPFQSPSTWKKRACAFGTHWTFIVPRREVEATGPFEVPSRRGNMAGVAVVAGVEVATCPAGGLNRRRHFKAPDRKARLFTGGLGEGDLKGPSTLDIWLPDLGSNQGPTD